MMDRMKPDPNASIILIRSWSLLLISLWSLHKGKEKEPCFEEGVRKFYSYLETIGTEQHVTITEFIMAPPLESV